MAYLGNAPARSFISFERQVFTIVNSQTAYTLSHSVNNENDIRLVVNNIVQEPGSGKAYTASGTTLTLSAALVNGTDEMYCVFLGRAVATNAPGAGSVGTSQLVDLNVTTAKIAADAITEAKIADNAVESEHLNNNIISGQTELASEPADTDEFLISDAGTIKRIDYSLIKGGGTHVLLSTTTVSSGVAQVDFTSGIDSTYKNYMITITDCHPVDNAAVLNMRISHSGTFQTANNYAYTVYGGESNGSDVFDASGGTDRFVAIGNIGAGGDQCGNSKIILCNPSGTTFGKQFYADSFSQTGNSRARREIIGGFYNSGTAVDGVRFFFNSGNIESGLFKLYGIV